MSLHLRPQHKDKTMGLAKDLFCHRSEQHSNCVAARRGTQYRQVHASMVYEFCNRGSGFTLHQTGCAAGKLLCLQPLIHRFPRTCPYFLFLDIPQIFGSKAVLKRIDAVNGNDLAVAGPGKRKRICHCGRGARREIRWDRNFAYRLSICFCSVHGNLFSCVRSTNPCNDWALAVPQDVILITEMGECSHSLTPTSYAQLP